jgi:hypothetical protein
VRWAIDGFGTFKEAERMEYFLDGASGEHGVVLALRKWIDAMLRCRSVRKSGIPTGRSTVPSVVEHGGGRATLIMGFCCKKASL